MITIARLKKLIQENIFSGITVGLLSVPIGVSLALSSSSSPISGVITAFWCGLMGGLFGGSNYNIIGPTGTLAGLLIVYAHDYGSGALPIIAILSGLFCIAAYFFRVERYLVFVPGSALHGFVLGVALIIIFGQIKNAFGLTLVSKNTSPLVAAWQNICNIHTGSWDAFIIFSSILTGLMIYSKFTRLSSRIPGTVVFAPIGIYIGYLCSIGQLPLMIETLGAKCGDLPQSLIIPPEFVFRFSYIIPAFCIAAVSILEVMISARIADGMTKTRHHKGKELLGLAYGNIAAGLSGGIPGTAALARTAINIRSGCTHRISAFISSICVGIITLLFINYFKFMPLPAIASILVFVAIRMLETDQFLRLFHADKKSFALALVVAFLTIYEDPVVGILMGCVIAMLLFMERLSDGFHNLAQTYTTSDGEENLKKQSVITYTIKGSLAYINAQAHLARIESACKDYQHVILDLHDVHLVDLDGVDCICDIISMLEHMNKHVYITGCSMMTKHFFMHAQHFKLLASKGQVFETVHQAHAHIAQTQIH